MDRKGFITKTDLRILGVSNRVAVYCPHSYNFSGNLFLVSPDRIAVLDIPASEAMKFAVSAGEIGRASCRERGGVEGGGGECEGAAEGTWGMNGSMWDRE